MKKYIFILVFLTISLLAFGQVNSEHLLFMGIPMDGSIKSFTSKLEQKGLELIELGENDAVLFGTFAGQPSTNIVVMNSGKRDLVCNIAVLFSPSDTWNALTNTYYRIKYLLIEKYGETNDVTEKFEGTQPISDKQRMYELLMNRCHYSTFFYTNNGIIQLKLGTDSESKCFVVLIYLDSKNSAIRESDSIDDL